MVWNISPIIDTSKAPTFNSLLQQSRSRNTTPDFSQLFRSTNPDDYMDFAKNLASSSGSKEERRVDSRIRNTGKQIVKAGGELPPSEPDNPWWIKGLNFIDSKVHQPIVSPLADIAKNGWSGSHILDDIKNGWNGSEHHSFQEVIDNSFLKNIPGINTNMDQITNTLPIMKYPKMAADWTAHKIFGDAADEKIQQRDDILKELKLGGMLGDAATDLTSYLTLGSGGAVRAAGKAGETAYKQALHMTEEMNLGSAAQRETWAQAAAQAARDEALRQGNKNLVGLRMPFTDSTATVIGKSGTIGKNGAQIPIIGKGIAKMFERKAEPITAKQVADLHSKLEEVGMHYPGDQQATSQLHRDVISKIPGINRPIKSLKDLNQEELSFITKYIDDFRNGQIHTPPTQQTGWKFTPKQKLKDVANQVSNDFVSSIKLPPNNGKKIAQWMADNHPELGTLEDYKSLHFKDLQDLFNQVKPKGEDLANQLDKLIGQGNVKIGGKTFNIPGAKYFAENFNDMRRGAAAGVYKTKFPQFSKLNDQPKQFNVDKDFLNKINDTFKPSGEGRSDLNRWFFNTKAGSALDNNIIRPFSGARYVPHSTSEKNPGLKDAVNILHDENTQTHAEQKQAFDQIAQVLDNNKATKEERDSIGYYLEGTRDITQVPERVRNVAEFARKRLDAIAQREIDEKIMEPGKTRKNYVPHIYSDNIDTLDPSLIPDKIRQASANSQNHGFSKIREGFDTIDEFDKWKADHPDSPLEMQKDIAKQLGIREAASIRAINNRRMISKLKDVEGGAYVKNRSYKDYVQVKVAGGEDVYVHPELAKHFQYINNLFTHDQELSRIVRAVNKVQHMWKQYITAALPSHHMKNLTGNMVNSRMAGVDLSSYDKAFDFMYGSKKGDPGMQKVWDEAVKRGIIKGGFFGNDFDTGINQAIDFATHKDGILGKIPNTLRRTIGEPIEDLSRFAHFMDIYKKTGSFQKATDSVHKFLFNYFELSKTEKSVRAFVPFYTWMRNNIPLQIEQAVKNPRYAATYGRVYANSNDNGDVQHSYMKESGDYFGVGGQNFVNPFLPMQDLKAIDPRELASSIVTGQTPFLKIPNEIMNNKIMFTGSPIDRYDDGKVDWGDSQHGYLGYGIDQLGLLSKINDMMNPRTNDSSLTNELAGLLYSKPIHVDQQTEKMNRKYEYARKQDAIKKRMKAEGLIK